MIFNVIVQIFCFLFNIFSRVEIMRKKIQEFFEYVDD